MPPLLVALGRKQKQRKVEGRERMRWAVPASILRCVPGNCQLEGQIVHYPAPSQLIAPRRMVTSQLKCSAAGASTALSSQRRPPCENSYTIYMYILSPPTNPPALAFFSALSLAPNLHNSSARRTQIYFADRNTAPIYQPIF